MRSPLLDESAVVQLGERLAQLPRVHHDRPVPGHRLLERLAGDEQEADALSPACTTISSPRSNRTSERFSGRSRLVVDALRPDHLRRHRAAAPTRRGSVPRPRRRTRTRGASSRPAAPCACRAAPRCRGTADRPRRLPPARFFPQNSPHTTRTSVPSSSVISGMSFAFDVLVARHRHLERRRQVRPELEPVHAAVASPFGISWWRMPLPAVIHCTSPAPSVPWLPRLSPCSTVPAST